MLNRFIVSLFFTCFFCFNVSATNNPFAKTESLEIGKDISWIIDKESVQATKPVSDGKGTYYHLRFDNKQLALFISSDASGLKPKQFSQLEILDVQIDSVQSSLFKWCLNNQQRHSRFLQQDLKVKKDICVVDSDAGSFIMQLNLETLTALQKGKHLLILLKPFRTPLEMHYDISDFNNMYVALNAKTKPAGAAVGAKVVVEQSNKLCMAEPPVKYKNIKPVEYHCDNATEKKHAEAQLNKLIDMEKTKQQKLAAEQEKQRKLAEQKKQKELADKLAREKKLQAEAAAIAASEAKRAQISNEITQKMLAVCEKYWSKGEHRCYCQKYIEHAPGSIQANSTCN